MPAGPAGQRQRARPRSDLANTWSRSSTNTFDFAVRATEFALRSWGPAPSTAEVVTVTDELTNGYDVVVPGGGAAGLNGALMFGPGPAVGGRGRCWRPAQLPGRGGARPAGSRRRPAGRADGARLRGGTSLRRPAGGRGGHHGSPRRGRVHGSAGRRQVVAGTTAAGGHRAGRRAAGRARGAAALGSRRAALPLLPRVGSPRPGHRRARQRTDVRPPGVAVPPMERGHHLLQPHDAAECGAGRAVRCPWHPRGRRRGGSPGGRR